jgi:predicted Zn-dependent protease
MNTALLVAAHEVSRKAILTVLLLGLTVPALAADAAGAKPAAPKSEDVLLAAMRQELQRATSALGNLDPAPYYTSYSVYDQDSTAILGQSGSLVTTNQAKQRTADVIMRVGTAQLDNTHGENRASGITSGPLPLNNDRDALARVLWQLTNEEYRRAAKSYLNVKTSNAVRTKEEDTSADFSEEPTQTHLDGSTASFNLDRRAWEDKVRRYSGYLAKYAEVYTGNVLLLAQKTRLSMVASDGTNIVTPGGVVRLLIQAETRAEDGMELMRVETFQAASPERLPTDAEIEAKVKRMAEDLKALRAAPVAEPFNGPALLSGRAAAVFFHEVLGHRLEGHRQRGDEEGQTFTKKINEKVLPDFLSVTDDPTQRVLNGSDLSGYYQFDNEGTPAARVEVIKDGVLKNFLMSRMPIQGFSDSNGHGRSQPGLMPTGRQGNLIVTSSHGVKDSELRQKLVEEVKSQGKPYGLFFEDIQGGFTLTTRAAPQAFQVLPVMVWRVYADGRPDELVRGVDIVGTPLAALTRIKLTGEKVDVFNGICGAESGSVPVSASSPAMLFSEMEVQKRAHSHDRPPLLAPPGFETSGGGKGGPR